MMKKASLTQLKRGEDIKQFSLMLQFLQGEKLRRKIGTSSHTIDGETFLQVCQCLSRILQTSVTIIWPGKNGSIKVTQYEYCGFSCDQRTTSRRVLSFGFKDIEELFFSPVLDWPAAAGPNPSHARVMGVMVLRRTQKANYCTEPSSHHELSSDSSISSNCPSQEDSIVSD